MPTKNELSTAEFKGSVIAKLEALHEDMQRIEAQSVVNVQELKVHCAARKVECGNVHREQFNRLRRLERPTLSTSPIAWLISLFKS